MSQQPTLIATTRARIAILLITAAALALSACTGPAGAEPSASPAPAASAAAQSPRPTSTNKPASEDSPAENVPVPEMPDEASLKSQQGLEAFIPYWFDLLSYAYESGDLEPLKGYSGPDCFICKSFSETVREGNSGDRWIVGGKLTVTDIEDRYEPTVDGSYSPIIFLTQGDLKFYRSGTVIATVDGFAKPKVWVVSARYEDGTWKMLDVKRPKDASK